MSDGAGAGTFRLWATTSSTASICSRVTSNWSITSSTLMSSRFSNTVATGIRVSLNTHAPLRLPGMLSTAGHCDQSRVAVAIILHSFYQGTPNPLLLRHRHRRRLREMVEVQNRVRQHIELAQVLPPVARVGRKQHHPALSHRCVDDRRTPAGFR